jgi:IS30 family transposase
MAYDLDATISFAHPCASWERGVNENTNGLIRQFSLKSRDLTSVSEEELASVNESLNHRPRKTLGFRTPHEVFFDTTTSFTVALTS